MPHLVMHQIPPAAGAWVSTFEDGIPRWFQSRRPRCPPDHDSARRTSRHLPRPCCGVRIQRHLCPPLRRWRVLTHGHGGRPAVQRRGVTAPSPWRQLTGNGCSFPNGSDCSGFPFRFPWPAAASTPFLDEDGMAWPMAPRTTSPGPRMPTGGGGPCDILASQRMRQRRPLLHSLQIKTVTCSCSLVILFFKVRMILVQIHV
jgi:hypothetical protein